MGQFFLGSSINIRWGKGGQTFVTFSKILDICCHIYPLGRWDWETAQHSVKGIQQTPLPEQGPKGASETKLTLHSTCSHHTMHYRLRPIGISELCLSFYSHPNISDGNFILVPPLNCTQIFHIDFFEAKINIFLFSFSIHCKM